MNTTPSSLASLPRVLAVSLVCLLPVAASAQPPVLALRNECQVSVTVQTSTVIRGRVVLDQPVLLRSGEVGKFKLNADKIVTIADTRSNQILFRETLKMPSMDLAFSIQPDRNKVKLRKPEAKE